MNYRNKFYPLEIIWFERRFMVLKLYCFGVIVFIREQDLIEDKAGINFPLNINDYEISVQYKIFYSIKYHNCKCIDTVSSITLKHYENTQKEFHLFVFRCPFHKYDELFLSFIAFFPSFLLLMFLYLIINLQRRALCILYICALIATARKKVAIFRWDLVHHHGQLFLMYKLRKYL